MDSRITSERLTANDSYNRGGVPARGANATRAYKPTDRERNGASRRRPPLSRKPPSISLAHPRIHTLASHAHAYAHAPIAHTVAHDRKRRCAATDVSLTRLGYVIRIPAEEPLRRRRENRGVRRG